VVEARGWHPSREEQPGTIINTTRLRCNDPFRCITLHLLFLCFSMTVCSFFIVSRPLMLVWTRTAWLMCLYTYDNQKTHPNIQTKCRVSDVSYFTCSLLWSQMNHTVAIYTKKGTTNLMERWYETGNVINSEHSTNQCHDGIFVEL
jgi:hypothetical protein